MPWTPTQTRYLLSSGSPLSAVQKENMKSELHADPSLAHRKKKKKRSRLAEAFRKANGKNQ